MDYAGTFVGVRVATAVPETLLGQAPALEFDCEEGSGGGLYLLLNCDEATLQHIREELEENGLPSLRSGMSYRPSRSGRAYRWYVRMEDEVDREAVQRIFREKHKLDPGSQEAKQAWDEFAAGFDEELAVARAQAGFWKSEAETLHASLLESASDKQEAFAHAASSVLGAVFPDLQLIRDSHDVITRELEALGPLFRELHGVVCKPEDVRAAAVRGADGWRELHYSTGQKDDGRLYFKRAGSGVAALVSFKRDQDRDIQYLRKH